MSVIILVLKDDALIRSVRRSVLVRRCGRVERHNKQRICYKIIVLVFTNATVLSTESFQFRLIIVFKSLILLSRNTLFQIDVHFKRVGILLSGDHKLFASSQLGVCKI